MFHLQSTFMSLLRLFIAHAAVHFPVKETKGQRKMRKWRLDPYIIDSTDFGLMNIAMGYSWATWSRLIALPETSKIQCFLCCKTISWLFSGLTRNQSSPSRRPLARSLRMFHKDCRYTVQLRWTNDSGYHVPFARATRQSDSHVRRPHIHAWLGWYLCSEANFSISADDFLSKILTWNAASEFIGVLGY